MSENNDLLTRAATIGLDADTFDLLMLVPLVYVAWADGEVQPEELQVIGDSADRLGVSGEASREVLNGWLNKRPSTSFFRDGLKLVTHLLSSLPSDAAVESADDVASLCQAVAQAAGGLSGHQKRLDASEMLVLREISQRLKLGSRDSARRALAEIVSGGGAD